MFNNNEIDKLLLAYKAGTIDQSGRLKLEVWADQAEENRALLDLFAGTSPIADELKTLYSYDEQRVWRNIRREAIRRRRKRIFSALLRTTAAAALLLGILGGGEFLYSRYQARDVLMSVIPAGQTAAVLQLSSGRQLELTGEVIQHLTEEDNTAIEVDAKSTKFTTDTKTGKHNESLFNKIIVPKGGEYQLELCDGTKVWLNSQSEITFPTRFDDHTRTVELKGEAYFEVTSNPEHPFIVKTDQMSVKVLGTSFNIMTYSDDPIVETTLISGSLKVIKDNVETLLAPGMQAQIDKQSNTITTRVVYAESYAAWAKQMFVFFNEPIESICRKLSRWYDVEIDASAESLRTIRYSGMIERAETFNKIVDLLSATDELVFRERDGKVIVETKKP